MVNVQTPTMSSTTSILFILVSYSSASFGSNRPISTSSLAMSKNVLPPFKARSGSSRHSNTARYEPEYRGNKTHSPAVAVFRRPPPLAPGPQPQPSLHP